MPDLVYNQRDGHRAYTHLASPPGARTDDRTMEVHRFERTFTMTDIDYRQWDTLPRAASEFEAYLERLLNEAPIDWHDISARAKSISSFQEKLSRKLYKDPVREVTDTVAARIITYSTKDRERVEKLIRERFAIGIDSEGAIEDKNPGDSKDPRRRGYDCQHFVVTGEKVESGWIVKDGALQEYFQTFGGLEIQVRTVAEHAWAEFEHDRRYKGNLYDHVSETDQEVIDQLFGAAADARHALDEIFVSIEKVLANPGAPIGSNVKLDNTHSQPEDPDLSDNSGTSLDAAELNVALENRFPESNPGSPEGVNFAIDLLRACGIDTVEKLDATLETVDSAEVENLMDLSTPVTRVRRLDDELLTVLGNDYIEKTGTIGNVPSRKEQLQWRYDRVRGKINVGKYKTYSIVGQDAPTSVARQTWPATAAFRTLIVIIAELLGSEAVTIDDAVSLRDDLRVSARARELKLNDGETVWVATNLGRGYSEDLMKILLRRAHEEGLKIEVFNEDMPLEVD